MRFIGASGIFGGADCGDVRWAAAISIVIGSGSAAVVEVVVDDSVDAGDADASVIGNDADGTAGDGNAERDGGSGGSGDGNVGSDGMMGSVSPSSAAAAAFGTGATPTVTADVFVAGTGA
ncbi:hypothetical protein [Bifidobacterium samirii]|uniref:hypothetical protein n=1 Tax=Bifidobacterium samirii TaxID=2306974 RepID=UPI001F49F11C|nr:hypothetical protein [Bifidobacterium samirii]